MYFRQVAVCGFDLAVCGVDTLVRWKKLYICIIVNIFVCEHFTLLILNGNGNNCQ